MQKLGGQNIKSDVQCHIGVAQLKKERNTARRKRAQAGLQNAPKVHNYTIAPATGALYQNCRFFSILA
jgi:hypothetical protein